jgi:carbon storage regulator
LLLLTRRVGESIFIGDHIVVKLHSVSAEGETVRLGIEAPKETKIQRAEQFEGQSLMHRRPR